MTTLYDFSVDNQEGSEWPLKKYKGKVLLIVNTATKCGFTKQYKALEKLYNDFVDKDFEILDFPCNQFAEQAPESDEDINQFCNLNYGTTFPRFKKIDVNGVHTPPLFQWLKDEKTDDTGEDADAFNEKIQNMTNFDEENAINWNFTKFLINQNGEVVERYSPTVDPSDIKGDISILLES